jgi:uncharacterized delta-60 repeat protein
MKFSDRLGLFAIAVVLSGNAPAQVPLPDPQWGTNANSIAYVGFDLDGTQNDDEFWSALLLPDGKLLVAGAVQVIGTQQYDIGIARLNATDGAADPLFGIGGRVALNVASVRSPHIARGSDGKIWYAAIQTQPVAVLGRLLENGSVDNSFDLDGRRFVSASLFLDAANYLEAAPMLVPLPDGKALLVTAVSRSNPPLRACVAVMRVNVDGSNDATFAAGAGHVCEAPSYDTITLAIGFDVKRLPDGKVLIAGGAFHTGGNGADMFVLRLTSEGLRDTSFGVDGWAFVPFDQGGNLYDVANALDIDSSGRIVIVGRAGISGTATVGAVARLTSTGDIDTTFGQQGRTLIIHNPLPPSTYYDALGVSIQPNGSVFIAGPTTDGSASYAYLATLKPDGTLDTTFGNGGEYDLIAMTASQVLLRGDYVYALGTGLNPAQSGNYDFTVMRRILPLFRANFEQGDL